MLKSRAETQDFIRRLFDNNEIEINGIAASSLDLVCLCENIASGKANVKSFKQYIRDGRLKKICVNTI